MKKSALYLLTSLAFSGMLVGCAGNKTDDDKNKQKKEAPACSEQITTDFNTLRDGLPGAADDAAKLALIDACLVHFGKKDICTLKPSKGDAVELNVDDDLTAQLTALNVTRCSDEVAADFDALGKPLSEGVKDFAVLEPLADKCSARWSRDLNCFYTPSFQNGALRVDADRLAKYLGDVEDLRPAKGRAGGGAPVGGAPVGGAPVGGAPVGGAPVGGAPVGGAPVVGAPVVGAPVGGAPVGGAPVVGAPVVGAPVVGAPVVGAPVVGAPVVGAPVVGAPVVGAPVVGAPVGGAPVGGAPVVVGAPGTTPPATSPATPRKAIDLTGSQPAVVSSAPVVTGSTDSTGGLASVTAPSVGSAPVIGQPDSTASSSVPSVSSSASGSAATTPREASPLLPHVDPSATSADSSPALTRVALGSTLVGNTTGSFDVVPNPAFDPNASAVGNSTAPRSVSLPSSPVAGRSLSPRAPEGSTQPVTLSTGLTVEPSTVSVAGTQPDSPRPGMPAELLRAIQDHALFLGAASLTTEEPTLVSAVHEQFDEAADLAGLPALGNMNADGTFGSPVVSSVASTEGTSEEATTPPATDANALSGATATSDAVAQLNAPVQQQAPAASKEMNDALDALNTELSGKADYAVLKPLAQALAPHVTADGRWLFTPSSGAAFVVTAQELNDTFAEINAMKPKSCTGLQKKLKNVRTNLDPLKNDHTAFAVYAQQATAELGPKCQTADGKTVDVKALIQGIAASIIPGFVLQ